MMSRSKDTRLNLKETLTGQTQENMTIQMNNRNQYQAMWNKIVIQGVDTRINK